MGSQEQTADRPLVQPVPLSFTEQEKEEARRVNARLDKLPRFRMETIVGRLGLNALLRVVEMFPDESVRSRRIVKEHRTISALGREVDVRIFRPKAACGAVLIEIHGGGWTIGNARMSDSRNAELVLRTGFAVVSVDYRLAVSNPVEELVKDCESAAIWTIAHSEREFGTGTVLLQGESAGSHLAASMLLRLRDRHQNAQAIKGVVLSFGLYDFSGTPAVRSAGPETLILHGPTIRTTLRKLSPEMSDEERRSPELSPLYADLEGLPPALFIVGSKDVLLEDNQRMEARWRAANGNSELLVAPESPHAFTRLRTAIARKVRDYMLAWLMDRARRSRSSR